jgi:hypothetical protein
LLAPPSQLTTPAESEHRSSKHEENIILMSNGAVAATRPANPHFKHQFQALLSGTPSFHALFPHYKHVRSLRRRMLLIH